MKARTPRELIAQAAIALAVCVGAWMMFVKPKIDEVARLDQQIAEHASSQTETVNQQTVEEAARKISALRDRIRDIESFNSLASDSSRFYGIVMDLADSHGVLVHNLQPGSTKQTDKEGKVTLTRITLGAEGEYARIASFLDAVCNANAFIRPVSLQLDPSRDMTRTSVQATLTCDVLSFAMDAALQQVLVTASASTHSSTPVVQNAMRGTSHAQP